MKMGQYYQHFPEFLDYQDFEARNEMKLSIEFSFKKSKSSIWTVKEEIRPVVTEND